RPSISVRAHRIAAELYNAAEIPDDSVGADALRLAEGICRALDEDRAAGAGGEGESVSPLRFRSPRCPLARSFGGATPCSSCCRWTKRRAPSSWAQRACFACATSK